MSFYLFPQNNSGGIIVEDGKVAEMVIVEADTVQQANDIASSGRVGIYDHWWCDCCGERFSALGDGWVDTPYATLEEAVKEGWKSVGDATHDVGMIAHLKDGSCIKYRVQDKPVDLWRRL
jgi:hypothetical protein